MSSRKELPMFEVAGLVDGTMFTHSSTPGVRAMAERIRKALEGGAVYDTRHDLAEAMRLDTQDREHLPGALFRMSVTGHVDEGPRAIGPYRWTGRCRCEGGGHVAASLSMGAGA
jgi:hypothetical protein